VLNLRNWLESCNTTGCDNDYVWLVCCNVSCRTVHSYRAITSAHKHTFLGFPAHFSREICSARLFTPASHLDHVTTSAPTIRRSLADIMERQQLFLNKLTDFLKIRDQCLDRKFQTLIAVCHYSYSINLFFHLCAFTLNPNAEDVLALRLACTLYGWLN